MTFTKNLDKKKVLRVENTWIVQQSQDLLTNASLLGLRKNLIPHHSTKS